MKTTYPHMDLERALFCASVITQIAGEVLDLVVHGVDMLLQPRPNINVNYFVIGLGYRLIRICKLTCK